jgi:hypothetical protein
MEGKLYQRRFLMMKVVLFSCLMVFFFSCACNRKIEQKDSISKAYLITDIKAKNSWYLIYAERLDTCYKIVVKKHEKVNRNCEKIIVGNYYNLNLRARSEKVIEIRGVNINPINNIDVHCYSYDEDTNICIEPENGIFDLYYTDDLTGLYYLKKLD